MKLRVAALVAAGLVASQLSFATHAFADPAFDLWTQGKYDEAIKTGLAENNAEGLSVAARAAASDMTMRTTPCLECATRTEELARKALAADPKAALPTIYLAGALGYRGRIIGMMAAQSAKLGEQSKAAIEAALAAHPKDAQLLATMAGWHFEVVRVGGSMLARWTYGASVDKGLAKFDEALKIAPNDLVVNYLYGCTLAANDAKKFRPQIEAAWTRVANAQAPSVYEQAQKKRAGELLALLRGNDRKAFDAKLKIYMGIPLS